MQLVCRLGDRRAKLDKRIRDAAYSLNLGSKHLHDEPAGMDEDLGSETKRSIEIQTHQYARSESLHKR